MKLNNDYLDDLNKSVYRKRQKLKDYFLSKGFNLGEVCLIIDGLINGIDVPKYAHLSFSYDVMNVVKEGLESGIDVSEYALIGYNSSQLAYFIELLQNGELPEEIVALSYSADTMKAINACLKNGLDYSIFVKYPILSEYCDEIIPLIKEYDLKKCDFSYLEESPNVPELVELAAMGYDVSAIDYYPKSDLQAVISNIKNEKVLDLVYKNALEMFKGSDFK